MTVPATLPVAPTRRIRSRPDLLAVAGALALVTLAVIVGYWRNRHGQPVQADTPPLYASWRPRWGPGTVPALAVAALVGWLGPRYAARWPWRRLLVAGYLGAVSWTLSLACVDGWYRGVARRLTMPGEYLPDARHAAAQGVDLHDFIRRIADFQPDSWQTQVAAHPPGALLLFVGMVRLGIGGGGAGLACVLIGATVAVSVPLTLRVLGAPAAARDAVPFLVLFPGAVWIGVSGDGLFAGLLAAGVALLAAGCAGTGRRADLASFAAGLLLGLGLFLSYGYLLFGLIALVPAGITRRVRPVLVAGLAVALVVATFALAGFWWLAGYHAVVLRYYQGIAALRAYQYWVWADLACLVLCAGPAGAPVIRRAVVAAVPALRRAAAVVGLPPAVGPSSSMSRRPAGAAPSPPVATRWRPDPAVLLPLAALAAMLAATLSGLSKAEVERIWLPFAVWLPAGAGLLPAGSRRAWLLAQAATALLINHLLYGV